MREPVAASGGFFVPLDRLSPGCGGQIDKIGGRLETRRRLMDMGLHLGARVSVLMAAPLGGPVILSVRGSILSVRRAQAALISVRAAHKQSL